VTWGAEAVHEASEVGLRVEHLYQPRAKALFNAALILADRGDPIDPITLEAQLRRTGEAQLFGGPDRLPIEGIGALGEFRGVVLSRSVKGYARIIEHAASRRNARLVLSSALQQLDAGDIDPDEWPNLVQRWRDDLSTVVGTGGVSRSAGWSIDEVLDMVETEWESEAAGNVRGISTGFALWDQMLGRVGPRAPWVVCLAGRPAMGKSTLAQSVSLSCALPHLRGIKRPGKPIPEPTPVLWACSEMTAAEIARSFVSNVGALERRAVESPDAEWMRVSAPARKRAVSSLRGSPITFVPDEQAGILEEIQAVARAWRAEHPREVLPDGSLGRRKPALIVIDYLQRLTSRNYRGHSREEEVNYLAKALKTMARDLDVVVLMLCQLNRKLEDRPDKRPKLSDLRESGAIEQESDVVSFVYRDHYYHPEQSPEDGAEIITAKNRKGPLGTVHVEFEGRYSRFLDLHAPGEPVDDDDSW